MSDTVCIGVVGCGYWGPNLIRNFRSLQNCHMKTMCDLSVDRLDHLKSLYPEIDTETNFDNLIEDPDIDAIAIATAVSHHHPLAKAALEAEKHVFIEKPMAASVEQCDELIKLAEQKGLILMVGHTFLFAPAIHKIKEIVESGDLGDIRYICARRLNLGLFQNDINVTWDLAPHDISIILHIMNSKPVALNCQGSSNVNPEVEDVSSITLKFENEKSAIIQNSWVDPRKIREMTIVGSKRMIVYDDVEPIEKIKIFDARVERPPHYDTFGEFQYAYHYGDRYIPYVKQDEPLKNQTQHFVSSIISSTEPLTGGENGREVVRILEAATQSLQRDGAMILL